MPDIDIGGVLVPDLLIRAMLAIAVSLLVRSLLSQVGMYRLIWHPALFDVALYILVLGLFAMIPVGV